MAALPKNQNLEDLYKYPWFFGELSEENAKEILEEAKQNDEKSEAKTIVFFKDQLWWYQTEPLHYSHYLQLKLLSGKNARTWDSMDFT